MTLFHSGDCGLFAILCPTKYISKSRSKTFQDISTRALPVLPFQ